MVAAIAGLGALVVAQFGIPAQIGVASAGVRAGAAVDLLVFTPIVALALALPAWHLFPRRAWPVLVVAGSVGMLPTLVAALSPVFDTAGSLHLVTGAAARPLLVVGVLGAATAAYRDGYRRAGAVVAGATLVVPPLAAFVVPPLLIRSASGLAVTGLVLVVVAAVVAVRAAFGTPPPAEPDPSPEWRVTAAGVVAGLTPVIYRLWPGPSATASRPTTETVSLDAWPDEARRLAEYAKEAADHSLIVGVIVLAIGVAVAIAAGVRVFVTGVAAGLLLGAAATLTSPAAIDLYDLPDFLPAVLGAVALAIAVVLALPRYRVVVGVSCLGLLIAGLLVLYLAFTADEPVLDTDVTRVVTPVLLAVTVVGMLSVCTSLGLVVLPASATPATYAGVVGAVAAGVAGIGASYALDPPSDTPPTFAIYPPVMAFLVVAGALTLFAAHRWQAGARD